MALTKLRIGKQLAPSASARSILITDGSSEPAYHAPVTGVDSILFWDHSASNWAQLTLGANLNIVGTQISATAGAGGYSNVLNDGTGFTNSDSNTKLNFVGSALQAADGGSGETDITIAAILNTIATDGAVNLTTSVTGDLPLSNLAQGSALSVLGVTGNATADNASIVASADHQVLRRSGTSVGFGAINLAQSNAVTGILPATNGGTGYASYAIGDILAANGATSFQKIPAVAVGQVLKSAGTATVPVWGTLAASDLTDGDNIAHINATETITSAWTFNTLPQSSVVPTTNNQFTNKAYVDSLIANQRKLSVRGASVGANITLSGTQTVDGVALIAGDRFLAKDQTTTGANGIYVVAAGAWTRATDMDTAGEVDGTFVIVEDGTVQSGTIWLTVSEVTNLGTDAITFTQVNKATDLIAGNGLLASGLTWNVVGTAGNIVANADSIDLATTAATPGSYGSATQVATYTVDAYGRLTASGQTTIALTNANISNFNEAAQDAVAGILTNTTTIDFTYDDIANTIVADVNSGSITFSKIQSINSDRLIGRDAAGLGVTTEIAVTNGLEFTGSNSIGHSSQSGIGTFAFTGAKVLSSITVDAYGHFVHVVTRDFGIDDLHDVTITGVTSGQVLSWSGSAWVNAAASGTITEAYTETLNSSTISLNSGTSVKNAEGTNIAFTTPSDKTKLFIYRNGLMLSRSSDDGTTAPRDYTVNTATHVVTFAQPVVTGEQLKFVKIS